MILSSVLMLRYLGLFEQASAIEHAIFVTLESGVLTGDVVGYDRGTPTTAYTEAIIGNLGKKTENWTVREVKPLELPVLSADPDYVRPHDRNVVGLDVFVVSPLSADDLGASLSELAEGTRLELKMISSRGTKVYPPTGAITDTLDHWRCRFIIRENPGDLWDHWSDRRERSNPQSDRRLLRRIVRVRFAPLTMLLTMTIEEQDGRNEKDRRLPTHRPSTGD